jgi:Tfp pilus assembly protein PilX
MLKLLKHLITIVGDDIFQVVSSLRELNPNFDAHNNEVLAAQKAESLARRGETQISKRQASVRASSAQKSLCPQQEDHC